MYTVRVTNDSVTVWHNDNGPDLSTVVANSEMKALRLACEGQFDPDQSPDLRARFAAVSDFESVRFTIINDSDYGFDWLDAIDAVACYYLPGMLEDAK